jgi:hypothetical protein
LLVVLRDVAFFAFFSACLAMGVSKVALQAARRLGGFGEVVLHSPAETVPVSFWDVWSAE